MISKDSIGITSVEPLENDRASACADFVRRQMPETGLFAGHEWRISPAPFPRGEELAKDIETRERMRPQF
ncbi:MAG: hypothetical protein HY298_08645 [Verrucomicrobia bacterium]|nr:hypothetical protein [Verrucomicrobiota bacterium]